MDYPSDDTADTEPDVRMAEVGHYRVVSSEYLLNIYNIYRVSTVYNISCLQLDLATMDRRRRKASVQSYSKKTSVTRNYPGCVLS